jgi:hypothetical protein
MGCAVCGADIAGARAALADRRHKTARVTRGIGVPRLSIGDDGLRIILALILALAAPLFGLVAACWFAYQTHSEGREMARNILLLIAVLAAVPLATGYSLWGRFLLGL